MQEVYLFGSTEAGNADVGSDIDLIVVRDGDDRQRSDLQIWLEGWSSCLAEISFQLYGVPSHGLLDVKYLDPEQAKLEIPSFSRAGKRFKHCRLEPLLLPLVSVNECNACYRQLASLSRVSL